MFITRVELNYVDVIGLATRSATLCLSTPVTVVKQWAIEAKNLHVNCALYNVVWFLSRQWLCAVASLKGLTNSHSLGKKTVPLSALI